MALEQKYKWLLKESGPLMVIKALELIDTKELSGKQNNPVIMKWAKEVSDDVAKAYYADEVPWCGLFMAVVAKRAKKQVVKDPLWALNWGNFGKYSPQPMLGDVMVFVRKDAQGRKAGHVSLYLGEDKDCYHVLGGNQSDQVCVTRILKTRLYTARRPNYNVQPKNVRVIKMSSDGVVSLNER